MAKLNLPDVALESSEKVFTPIDWVGMSEVELSVKLSHHNEIFRSPAKVEAKVSLDKKPSRGIHMSRLYMSAQQILGNAPLNLALLGQTVDSFLETHKDLSSEAFLRVDFEAPVLRDSLKSGLKSWRNYPVSLIVESSSGVKRHLVEVKVLYSSTCPASAALARQLIQQKFAQDFAEGAALERAQVIEWLGSSQGIVATPHAQRSVARIKVEVPVEFDYLSLLDWVEESLQTAVQGAVKREDEQEFALRNGQNLMFCEDAARRFTAMIQTKASVLDFIAEFSHIESLHPHCAVSRVSKGLNLKNF